MIREFLTILCKMTNVKQKSIDSIIQLLRITKNIRDLSIIYIYIKFLMTKQSEVAWNRKLSIQTIVLGLNDVKACFSGFQLRLIKKNK